MSLLKYLKTEIPTVEYQAPTKATKKVVEPKTDKSKVIMNDIKNLKTKIIIPDVHSFERDPAAYEIMMKSLPIICDKYDVNEVIQLGDLLEVQEFSTHGRANVFEQEVSYAEEIEWAVEEFWGRIHKIQSNVGLVGLMGNHEDRIHNEILNKKGFRGAMAKGMHDLVSPDKYYGEIGVKVIPYAAEQTSDSMYDITPNLSCIHGWSIAANAAKAHAGLAMGSSIIFGHTHRTESQISMNPKTGANIGTWSFGAIAKVHMRWQKKNAGNHSLGFGLVHTDGNLFNVNGIQMIPAGNRLECILPDGTSLSVIR